MICILLSICCSVFVSVILKVVKRYQIDIYQAIVWNYSAAILLSWIFLKPKFVNLLSAPFVTYTFLGVLLPLLFIILAISVKQSGIVRTDIAQRLSLLIPIIAAFLIFGEKMTILKSIGILTGFAAILCTIPWKQGNVVRKVPANAWAFLLMVFMGMGIIDVLFKQIAATKAISYGTSLFIVFVLAFSFSFAGLVYQVATKKMKFSWPHILIGWVLGIANFGNILFYIKAHKALANQPSTVFSAMNIGVIVFGALIGLIIFREKLSLFNKAGIVIAIIAVVILSIS
jgi:drug/metabolite transporter (DMT)-like permease